ncbi:MAG: hypothetical protein ACRCSF_04350 [Mycobacteriaceae bacterium]
MDENISTTAGVNSPSSRRKNLLVLTVVIAVGIAISLGVFFAGQAYMDKSDARDISSSASFTTGQIVSMSSEESEIRTSIENILLAYSVGNVAVLKNETCGGLKEEFALVSDQSLREETAKAFQERSGAFLWSTASTVKDAQAWVKATIGYDKPIDESNSHNSVQATFVMNNSDGVWRVCGMKADI